MYLETWSWLPLICAEKALSRIRGYIELLDNMYILYIFLFIIDNDKNNFFSILKLLFPIAYCVCLDMWLLVTWVAVLLPFLMLLFFAVIVTVILIFVIMVICYQCHHYPFFAVIVVTDVMLMFPILVLGIIMRVIFNVNIVHK